MEKNIKDYLHLYLGCDCIIGDLTWKRPIIAESDLAPYVSLDYGKPIRVKMDLHCIQAYASQITPILRPERAITEEEDNYYVVGLKNKYSDRQFSTGSLLEAERLRYLLSIGIDMFELIESGLALDATHLNKSTL